MARLYTGLGDRLTTRLADGSEVSKCDPRVEACGALDELNACIGVARAALDGAGPDDVLARLQNLLFEAGAEIAAPTSGTMRILDDDVRWIEREIDRASEATPPITVFILPAGTHASAQLHVARTVCRRAERAVVALAESVAVSPSLLRFVNRASDLLFALARRENHRSGPGDIAWKARDAT